MKKIVLCLYGILLHASVFPFFDLHPWIVIDNATDLHFTCNIQAACVNIDGDTVKIICNDRIDNFQSTIVPSKKNNAPAEPGKSSICHLSFTCKARSITMLNPIFYHDAQSFNPDIQSITMTHTPLQLAAHTHQTDQNQRYFTIDLQEDLGFVITAKSIPTHIWCLNTIHISLRHFITTIQSTHTWFRF